MLLSTEPTPWDETMHACYIRKTSRKPQDSTRKWLTKEFSTLLKELTLNLTQNIIAEAMEEEVLTWSIKFVLVGILDPLTTFNLQSLKLRKFASQLTNRLAVFRVFLNECHTFTSRWLVKTHRLSRKHVCLLYILRFRPFNSLVYKICMAYCPLYYNNI